ncbi:MAG: NYN domain-containing protein [Patescibacteria group bacterium]
MIGRLSNQSVYVFIDASNLMQAQKAKRRFLNYEKTLKHLKKEFDSNEIKVFYYTAYPAEGTRDYDLDGKHKFFTYLKKGLKFEVRKKPLKRIVTNDEHRQSVMEKGNMDVEMTIDVVHHMNKFDVAIFFTGDSDFMALVTHLRTNDKKVYIYSSRHNVAQELRTGADGYTDILDIEDDIWGTELKHRNQKD